MVSGRLTERGSALIFALAALTVVALALAAVASEVVSRVAAVRMEERSVLTIALADRAMAESLAELARHGAGYEGLEEQEVPGGTVASRVRAFSTAEVELVAVGRRVDWQTTITARVNLRTGPRVLWWQRTQGPAPDVSSKPRIVRRIRNSSQRQEQWQMAATAAATGAADRWRRCEPSQPRRHEDTKGNTK